MGYYTIETKQYVETVDNSETWSFTRNEAPSAGVSLWADGNHVSEVVAELLTPLPHPIFDFLFVKSVSMVGLGRGRASGQTFEHPECQLEVTYAPRNRSYDETVTETAQMITMPKWRFRWSNGLMLADGEEPSRIIRTQKITHSYQHLSIVPPWVHTDIGKVNLYPITTQSGLVCTEETLLYEGANYSRHFDPWGTLGWEITTNFSYNPNGWNRWFNTITGTWLEFQIWNVNQSTGQGNWAVFKMYELADLSGKF